MCMEDISRNTSENIKENNDISDNNDNGKITRIKELVKQLNDAAKKYYMEDTEIMSNLEYDALYDELSALEKETGMVMSNSPTVKVGYEVVSELPKEAHEHPMLSLDKTKDVGALASWLGGQKGVISWKMDGLTVVLTYENGEMIKAVTRGNGEIGEVITNNAKVFANVPHHIPYKGKLTIRGEAVIKYSDFNAINEKITDAESKYKNPRNLCSGSVRQLDNKITKERNVHFFAFNLVDGEDVDFHNSFKYQLDWLEQQGFTVVEHYLTDSAALPDKVREFSEKITENDFPSDGLVLMLWHTEGAWEPKPSSREMPWRSNGRTRRQSPIYAMWSGVHQELDSSTRSLYLIRWSLREQQLAVPAYTTSAYLSHWHWAKVMRLQCTRRI